MRLPDRVLANGTQPGARQPARHDHRHAERDLGQLDLGGHGIVDEIGLGEHDHGLRSGVEGQDELALEPALVGRGAEGVHEEHDVDVGGERVGLEPVPFERGPPHECRRALDDVFDAFAVTRTGRPNHRWRRRRTGS